MISRKNIGSRRGSVMMEYIVLNFVFLVSASLAVYFFTPSESKKNQYGKLGNAFIQRYQLMLKVVSMPYP